MAWEFVYGHDAAGNGVEGSRDSLIAAIEGGAEVRVFVDYAPVPGCYKDAQAIWIKDGHAFVQNTASIGAAFTPEYAWGSGSGVSADVHRRRAPVHRTTPTTTSRSSRPRATPTSRAGTWASTGCGPGTRRNTRCAGSSAA